MVYQFLRRRALFAWLVTYLLAATTAWAQVRIAPLTFSTSSRNSGEKGDLVRVIAAYADARSNVYVLDQRRREIVSFDSLGRFRYVAGHEGRGASQFAVPVSLKKRTRGREEQLHVWDPGYRRFFVFLITKDSLRLMQRVALRFDARDACMLDDRLFVSGFHEGKRVHEVASDGSVVRSFGEPLGPRDEFAQRRLSHGRLICDAVNRQIIIAAEQLPSIRAYAPDGALRWSRDLSRFASIRYVLAAGGGLTISAPSDSGADAIATVGVLSTNSLLVQTGRLSPQSKHIHDYKAVSTRVLNLRTGVEETFQQTLPWLVSVDGTTGFTTAGNTGGELRAIAIKYTGGGRP